MKTNVTKQALIAVGAALAAFAVALIGAYFAIPMVAPDVAAQARSADSLATAAGSTLSSEAEGATALAAAPADTSSAAPGTAAAAVTKALRDSLQIVQQRLEEVQAATNTLRQEEQALREQLSEAEDARVQVDELGSALLKMEERELNALLKEVDMSVLKQLYREASGRARTRLLQAMSPARAARFVNQMVEGPTSPSSFSPARPSSAVSGPVPSAATPSSR